MGVSERRARRVLSQPRSTQRYRSSPKADEVAFLAAIGGLVCQHPSYGYRLIHGMLVAAGHRVSRDRVYRLWKAHGYNAGKKRVKKRRLGVSQNGIRRRKSMSINDVWC